MTMPPRTRMPRGFTLIELMLVVCIIGLLSTIAVPEFQRSNLRAKAAERITIMESVARAVADKIVNVQEVAPGQLGSPRAFDGEENPPLPVSIAKRPFVWSMPGWKELSMVVEGGSYYSYTFHALDADGTGKTVTMEVSSVGDLDGDGLHSHKTMYFTAVGYSFQPAGEVPDRGLEDDVGPDHTF